MIDPIDLMSRWVTRSRAVHEGCELSHDVSAIDLIGHVIAIAMTDITASSTPESAPHFNETIKLQSHDIATKAQAANLPYNVLATTLQGFQIVLAEEHGIQLRAAERPDNHSGDLQYILQRTDQLTHACLREYRKLDTPMAMPDNATRQTKTLQHEIRTPLQGALLSSELLMEDVTNGDPVSISDVQAIRTSIETAIRVLNEFARC